MISATKEVNLTALGATLLERAASAKSGRATHVFRAAPGAIISQVFLGITAGNGLADHENPGEALLHVLSGRARLVAGDEAWELSANEHLVIPQIRHRLDAIEDTTVMLTVAKTAS